MGSMLQWQYRFFDRIILWNLTKVMGGFIFDLRQVYGQSSVISVTNDGLENYSLQYL